MEDKQLKVHDLVGSLLQGPDWVLRQAIGQLSSKPTAREQAIG